MIGPPIMGTDSIGMANYPRYVAPGSGPGAIPPGPPIVRFASLEDAWNILRAELTAFVPCNLVLIAVMLALGAAVFVMIVVTYGFPFTSAVAQSREFQIRTFLWGLPLQLISYPLQAGFFWMCVKRLRGYPITISSMFEGYRAFIPLGVQGILLAVLGQVGSFLLYLPQILFLSLFTFASIAAIDQKTGVFDSFVVAARGLRSIGNILLLSLLMFLTAILLVVPGACTIGIGLIFLMPFYYLVAALHYHAFFPPQEAANQQPQSYAAPQYSA